MKDVRTLAQDVRTLGPAAVLRIIYETSKRTGGHALLFRASASMSGRRLGDYSMRVTLGSRTTTQSEARKRCLEDALLVRQKGLRVFGRRVPIGVAESWHFDPLTQQDWPRVPWWRIDIRSPKRLSDVKWTWEAGRHRDLVILARAASLDSQGGWEQELERLLRQWCRENPPEYGVNWYSSLELAIRAIAWMQVIDLAGDRLSVGTRQLMDRSLWLSARHIMIELPYTTSSMRNNHLLGDALGLLAIARLFPHRRASRLLARLGDRLFNDQLRRHMEADGSMVEDSLSYHRFVLEMLIVRLLLGGETAHVRKAIHGAAMHLTRLGALDADIPQYGDWDEGRVLASSGNAADVKGTTALALQLCGEAVPPGLASSDEVVWYGTSPAVKTHANAGKDGATSSGGLAYAKRGDWSVWFKAGRGESHGHADLGSVWIKFAGQWLVQDPGTGTYNGPLHVRNGFRKSSAHSCLRLIGHDQLGPHRSFRWLHQPRADLNYVEDREGKSILFGWHSAYSRVHSGLTLARAVIVTGDYVAVAEFSSLDVSSMDFAVTLPLGPGCRCRGGRILMPQDIAVPLWGVSGVETAGSQEPFFGWASETYGAWSPRAWLDCPVNMKLHHVWGFGSKPDISVSNFVSIDGLKFDVGWNDSAASLWVGQDSPGSARLG